jgi:hypothetical protein
MYPGLSAIEREGNVSERNGDKARFQRERKRKVLHRMRIRELRKALKQSKPAKGSS